MALRRTLRTSALPFRYWACPRPWRGLCGDGAAPIGFIRVKRARDIRPVALPGVAGWVWLFLSGGTMANGTHAVMVANGVPACILA